MMQSRRFPTREEMDAIELAARQARAQAIARLFAASLREIKSLIVRGATALAGWVRRARDELAQRTHSERGSL